MAGAFESTAFDGGGFEVGASVGGAFEGTAFNNDAFFVSGAAIPVPSATTGGSGGGARSGTQPAGRRGSAKIRSAITEDDLRDAYNKAMGLAPTANGPTPLPKAVKAAVRRHALEDALVPGVTPPASAIDWQAIMADNAAVAAFQALIARIARDEEDAIIALLLAA